MAVSYAEIEALETEWLWEQRIPRGEVTLIAGEGAVGKGQLLCDLAARVSQGWPMPLCEDGSDPGSVILVTPEDDPNETMAWRLRAAGADLARTFDLTMLESGAPFELPGSVAPLRALIEELKDTGHNPRLVVIDPLMAAISRPISTNLAARRVIAPLMRMAKETGVAVVMVHHTVKSGQIAGSKGLTDVLRYAYTVKKDPENEAIRVIHLQKGNNVPDPEDTRYTLTDGPHGAPRVVWLSRDELAGRRKAWRTAAGGSAAPMDMQARADSHMQRGREQAAERLRQMRAAMAAAERATPR
jgi:KaiC/GvpD/RAD55 family RecA-like ATPase